MNIQLFFCMILIVFPSVASHSPLKPTITPHVPEIDITIDDKITDPEERTIEVAERFSDPYDGDKEYKLRLKLDKQKKVWQRQYYETTYTQKDWRDACVMPTTVSVGKLPKGVENAFDKILDDTILSHIYLHRRERGNQVWKTAHKNPLAWLKHLPTLRRTEWVWSNTDQSTLLMMQTDPYRERLKRSVRAAYALHEASKKDAQKAAAAAKEANDPDITAVAQAASDKAAADKEAYEKQCTISYSQMLTYQDQDYFGDYFMLWKEGTFQEMQRQKIRAAQKKEKFKHKMAAILNRANKKHESFTSTKESRTSKLNNRNTLMLQKALRGLKKDLRAYSCQTHFKERHHE